MTAHLEDGRLHGYLDDELGAAERAEVEAHASSCPACARRLASFAEVRTGLDALPRSGRPPRDLWPGILERIERGADVVPLHVAHGAAPAPPAPREGEAAVGRGRLRRWALPLADAAGLAQAFATGALTWSARAGEDGEGPTTAAAIAAPDETPLRGRRAAGATYEEAIADLEALLARGRDRLDPVTVRTLEESLVTIDRAIADAEAALAEDPGSELIQGMLLGQQRAKYRVLTRASLALLPRS